METWSRRLTIWPSRMTTIAESSCSPISTSFPLHFILLHFGILSQSMSSLNGPNRERCVDCVFMFFILSVPIFDACTPCYYSFTNATW